ncbi:uncharacterized protein [Nicotiana tomentosiformis]|uniref:uncharacterized protein n=1 Tax=Nicotiana tomentosiformis TaxID=4098 RepID=UPI00388C5E35
MIIGGVDNSQGQMLKRTKTSIVREKRSLTQDYTPIETLSFNDEDAEWVVQPHEDALHVPREQNSEADALANLGSSVEEGDLSSRTVVQLSRSVIEEGHTEINSTSLTWDWRNKYIEYLKNGKLPSEPKDSRALQTKAARFTVASDGTLYRRTFDGPLVACLGPGDTDYILREVQEGTCGNHSGADSLVQKIIRTRYYWIDMGKDTREFV